jgi:beta-phosphoglucomutase-like phosphatase (HAD superfamily)
MGLSHLFQAVVVAEDVARQKPAPDIFLEAARRLGVPPANCRAYEDTDIGLLAIRAAGMEPVDVRPLLAAADTTRAASPRGKSGNGAPSSSPILMFTIK